LKRTKKKEPQLLSWLLYILFFASIALYAVTSNFICGIITILLFILILYYEVKSSLASAGMRRSIIDIGSAVGAAILVWILLIFLLRTSAPVDAVSSCSMLPALHRGDLVVLQGIVNVTQFAEASTFLL